MKLKKYCSIIGLCFLLTTAYGQTEKHEEAKRKPNYLIPVIAGAVGGIALALWLRRRKD